MYIFRAITCKDKFQLKKKSISLVLHMVFSPRVKTLSYEAHLKKCPLD